MKNRAGFTLAELILSVFIFSFIAASLATIVSTTNRHMFQNYRRNVLKTNVLLSMRRVQNNLSVATRIDLPLAGARNTSLAFAVNVDQTTGCYPISAADPASWHYFCLAKDKLYYHTGPITGSGSATACGKPTPSIWCANNPISGSCYAVPSCGGTGGTLLMVHVSPFL
ncbi:MAG: prepilin-type N-terminal cleavage/methylation domain-containing protein, partial [Elusimicrobiota bacterium]